MKIYQICFLVILFSCTHKSEVKESSNSLGDSSILQVEADNEEVEEMPITFSDLVSDYEYMSKDTVRVKQEICGAYFSMEFYSSKDSAKLIPKTFLGEGHEYLASSFVAELSLTRGDSLVILKNLTISDFKNVINDTSIVRYGSLLYPNVNLVDSTCQIKVNFSASIPLTDIGVPVQYFISTDGVEEFTSGY